MDFEMPVELEPFKAQFLATKKSFISIELGEEQAESPFQSKFGGSPYMPEGAEFPVDAKGNYLFFLAQINFAELPKQEHFPDKGILQFFVADDGMYGLDLGRPTQQNNFRVVFYEAVQEEVVTDFSFLNGYERTPITPGESFELKFEKGEELVDMTDYRFGDTIGYRFFRERFSKNAWAVRELYTDRFHSKGHKIGGYGHFTQEDPRTNGEEILLLQIDSDQKHHIMWGDMGIAGFYIKPEDLQNKDFSNVLFNWDCP